MIVVGSSSSSSFSTSSSSPCSFVTGGSVVVVVSLWALRERGKIRFFFQKPESSLGMNLWGRTFLRVGKYTAKKQKKQETCNFTERGADLLIPGTLGFFCGPGLQLRRLWASFKTLRNGHSYGGRLRRGSTGKSYRSLFRYFTTFFVRRTDSRVQLRKKCCNLT